MKRIAAIILAIALVICTIGAGATGGVDRIKINNLFEDLEYSLQEIGWDGRVNELIDCLDPNAVGLANWLIKLINVEPENLVGLVNAIIGVGSGVSRYVGDENELTVLMECLSMIRIVPKEYAFNYDKTRCSVDFSIIIEYYGEIYHDSWVLDCVKRDGRWYISPKIW